MPSNAELLDYAIGKFESGAYDEALEAFVLAYAKGYERDWILENVSNCYLAGNEDAFRESYGSMGDLALPYEECLLDFVPYQDGSYFVFDREMMEFRGKFDVSEIENTKIPVELIQNKFSDVAISMDWDWRDALYVLRCAKERKVYVISTGMPRILSFYKISELHEYLENVRIFPDYGEFQEYFHQHPGIYLPRIWVGAEEERRKISDAVNAEHAWRLTPEGRCTDNVLLTIAIPTHERGNLLLKRIENLKTMPYDAEIEVTISKNGTNLYQEEYEEASKIVAEDARFLYHDHGKELQYEQNWHYAVEMAHGRYVMFVSDEDDVLIENLDHYLRLLQDYPETSVLRASGIGPNFRPLEKSVHAKKGIESFRATFLQQNYLSGMVVRRKDFLDANFMSLLRYRTQKERNEFYCLYPHEWWCASLVQSGDYIVESLPLIWEERDKVEPANASSRHLDVDRVELLEEDSSERAKLKKYATYGERLKQFQDELEFLKLFFQEQERYWYVGLYKCVWKLFYLVEMARKYHYEPERFPEVVSECAKRCMEAVQAAPIIMEHQKIILGELEDYIAEAIELHKSLCAWEARSDG